MKKIISILLLFAPLVLHAQYVDSFSDGDFLQTPSWSGSVDKFIVNSAKQLQLKAPSVTSNAYLSTPSQAINDASWQFYMKAGLLLTSANYVKFYLVSDSADLSVPLNGYFVMIGNTNKEVALYRQQGTTKTKLVSGITQRLPTTGSSTEITIKVTRDSLGHWSLYSKLPSESDFVLEGSVMDSTFIQSSYSGMFCNYSSTNSTKYFFDDFVVTGNPFVDRIPPAIASCRLIGNNQFEVLFSEPVVLSDTNLLFTPSLGSFQSTLTGNHLLITFPKPIPIRQSFALQLSQVKDLSGNLMPTASLPFGIFSTSFGDVVFNELMVNPTPTVGLPQAQYIELYNRRDFPIQLKNWTLTYGSKPFTITDGQLNPHGFVLLCDPATASVLSVYGHVVAMSSFPSMAKSGQMLSLSNDQDSLMAFVNYSDTWYRDDFKQSGGWALECVDPSNASDDVHNWVASKDISGGTPDKANSVAGVCPDVLAPAIVSVSMTKPDTLTLSFNKAMLLSGLSQTSSYVLSDGLSATVLQTDFPKGQWVRLLISGNILHGMIYALTVNHLRDLSQHDLSQTIRFGLPDSCQRGDVVINEILSHPKPSGVSFVELYNRSQKIIDLGTLWLNRVKSSGGYDVGYPISNLGYQLFPEKYVALTTSKSGISNVYSCPDSAAFLEIENCPSLPNVAGNVELINRAGVVIDSVGYNESQHDPMIQDPTGVSFERISPDGDSNSLVNWHSASSDVGYATPGYCNSQYKDFASTVIPPKYFWTEKDFFTPDNDGLDDLLWLHYSMPDVGYSATITVYDAIGRRIKQLANNALLGSQGLMSWNGLTDSGKVANVGVYVLYVDAVQPLTGKRVQAKLPCALAAR